MSDLAEALAAERLHSARLHAALEKTAGALACRLPPMLHVTFSGRWRHLGRLSVGAILDEANAALSPREEAAAPAGPGGCGERSTG